MSNAVFSTRRLTLTFLSIFFCSFWLSPEVLTVYLALGLICALIFIATRPTTISLVFVFYIALSTLVNFGESDISIYKSFLVPFCIFHLFSVIGKIRSISINTLCTLLLLGCTPLIVIMFSQESPGQYSLSFDYLFFRERWMGYYALGSLEPVGPTIFAQLAALSLITSIYLTLQQSNIFLRATLTCLDLIFLFLLISSGSRTALIAAVLAILFILRSPEIDRKNSNRATSYLYLVAGASVFVVIISILASQSGDIAARVSSFDNLSQDESFMTRVFIWKDAVAVSFENIFGGALLDFYNMHSLSPHNEFLGVLLISGYIGLIAYLFLWGSFARMAIRLYRKGASSYFFALIVFTCLVSLTEHFTLSNGRLLSPLLFGIFGYMVGHHFQHRNSEA